MVYSSPTPNYGGRGKHKVKWRNSIYTEGLMVTLKINLFSPWYSWKIAELELNNNHSLNFEFLHNFPVQFGTQKAAI
jgi:hypothetical protein